MMEYKEVWSRNNSSIALAVFDNALNDHKLDSQKLISTPEHRPKQKDSFHPRWYGTSRKHIQVAKDKWAKNEGLPPHEHVSRPGYYQYMINNNYPDLHIDEFIYVIYGQLLVKIYDIDDSLIQEELLFENDFFIYWAGGAGVKALIDDTRVFVVKPGPYEGPEMDKRDIIDNHFKLNNF